MCRSIKRLRPAAAETPRRRPPMISERRLAVRPQISGFRAPSRANRPAFDSAVDEITAASERLLESLGVRVGRG